MRRSTRHGRPVLLGVAILLFALIAGYTSGGGDVVVHAAQPLAAFARPAARTAGTPTPAGTPA